MFGPATRALARLTTAILVAGLGAVGTVAATPTPAGAALVVDESWGKTAAPDGVLAKGCKKYAYRYKLTLPTDDWEMDLVIKDRTGNQVASAYLLSDSEPPQGKRWFRLCGASTKPGKFVIRAKVSSWDGWAEDERRLPNSSFRLRKR